MEGLAQVSQPQRLALSESKIRARGSSKKNDLLLPLEVELFSNDESGEHQADHQDDADQQNDRCIAAGWHSCNRLNWTVGGGMFG